MTDDDQTTKTAFTERCEELGRLVRELLRTGRERYDNPNPGAGVDADWLVAKANLDQAAVFIHMAGNVRLSAQKLSVRMPTPWMLPRHFGVVGEDPRGEVEEVDPVPDTMEVARDLTVTALELVRKLETVLAAREDRALTLDGREPDARTVPGGGRRAA